MPSPAEPPPGADANGGPQDEGGDAGPALVGSGVPAVVAVMVTRDPGPDFEEALAGLDQQDYSNLSVLVVDAGSATDPTPRVAAVTPSAFVKRVRRADGYGAAANGVFGVIEGATFFLFLHDDVQLAPGAVQALVAEAFRANAGIVGAKLVDWHDPSRLLSVGAATDKFGFEVPLAEPGERDQAQHDAPQEVGAVSHAAMLVRADLFADLGGFSAEMVGPGAEVDLCWRARVAGARTAVMPAAVARHLGSSTIGDPGPPESRRGPRNRARSMLANYSGGHLLRILPQAMVLSVLDALVSLGRGKWRDAADIVGAWGWNLAHLPGTIGARRRVQRARGVSDAEVRWQQVSGSARFSELARSLRAHGPEPAVEVGGQRRFEVGGNRIPVIVLLAVTAAVVLVGARGLWSGGVPVLRELASFRSPGLSVGEWWRGWRVSGVGAATAAPTSLPLTAALAALLTGATGLARTMFVVLALPLGAWGVWRSLAGAAGPWARAVGAVAYLLVPLGYSSVAEGRLRGLVAVAALPWILGRLLRAGAEPPFRARSKRLVEGFRLALVVAPAAAFAPELVPVTLFVALVLAVASVAAGRIDAARRTAAVGLVGSGVSAILLLPTLVSLAGGSLRWDLLTGGGYLRRTAGGLSSVVRLGGSTYGGAWLAAGLLVAAAVPLFGARAWRLRLAATVWAVGLASALASVVLHRQEWSWTPAPEVLLAVVAAAVGVAVCLGVESFTTDVRQGSFGLGQLVAVIGGLGLLVAVGPWLAALTGGRYLAPAADAPTALQTLDRRGVANFRTLWIGDRDTLPVRGWTVRGDIVAGLTEGVRPDLSTLAPQAPGGGERQVLDGLRAALDGQTQRVGRLLAPAGIRYIVVMAAGNPTGVKAQPAPAGPAASTMASQLDLNQVDVAPGMDVYENIDARPIRTVVPAAGDRDDPTTLRQLQEAAPVASEPVLDQGAAATDVRGPLGVGELLVAMTRAGGWNLEGVQPGGGPQSVYGWAQRYPVTAGGNGRLSYRPATGHTLTVVAQLLLVAAVAAAARPRRRRDREVVVVTVTTPVEVDS